MINNIFLPIFVLALGLTTYSNANVFEGSNDKNASCYFVNKNIPTAAKKCTVKSVLLNNDESMVNTIIDNRIFSMSNQKMCEDDAIETCFTHFNTLSYGGKNKINSSEYMNLAEEESVVYWRDANQKKIIKPQLFKVMNKNSATCMKSASYDVCFKSSISIQDTPMPRK